MWSGMLGPFSKCSPLICFHDIELAFRWRGWGSPNRILIFTLHSWRNIILFHDLVDQWAPCLLTLFFFYKINVNLVSLWIIDNKLYFQIVHLILSWACSAKAVHLEQTSFSQVFNNESTLLQKLISHAGASYIVCQQILLCLK